MNREIAIRNPYNVFHVVFNPLWVIPNTTPYIAYIKIRVETFHLNLLIN